jgi:hypothetical protein
LPWQIIGSATIYRPSSTLPLVRCLDLLMAESYTPEAALTRRSRRGRSPPETMNFQSEEHNGADAKAQRSRGARISAARHHQPLGGSI